MAGTFTHIQFHLVFSTKNREPYITAALKSRLYDYMGGIIRSEGGVLYEIGGTADHVHLLIRWRPDETLADLLRRLKSHSSLWVHKTFPDLRNFAWQSGYGAFSVSESLTDKVKGYIRDQTKHHRNKTFKEEFIEFLKAHEMEYDEKYIWV